MGFIGFSFAAIQLSIIVENNEMRKHTAPAARNINGESVIR